jgi:hypothetical protein
MNTQPTKAGQLIRGLFGLSRNQKQVDIQQLLGSIVTGLFNAADIAANHEQIKAKVQEVQAKAKVELTSQNIIDTLDLMSFMADHNLTPAEVKLICLTVVNVKEEVDQPTKSKKK